MFPAAARCRSTALGLMGALALALLAGCPRPPCQDTCGGCCTAGGTCVEGGGDALGCGSAGARCAPCASGLACSAGRCRDPDAGQGGGAGGGSEPIDAGPPRDAGPPADAGPRFAPGVLGQPCAREADCRPSGAGVASCVDALRSSGAATGFVGGTCALECLGDAQPNRGCPEDTACVKSLLVVGACTRCAPRCSGVGERSTCRPGYLCAPQAEDDGGTGACEPDCRNLGAVCGLPSSGCQLDSGFCADGGHVFGCPFIF